MKKIRLISLVLVLLGLASCKNDNEPQKNNPGQLSEITASTDRLIAGEIVKFEVSELKAATSAHNVQRYWTATNGILYSEEYKDGKFIAYYFLLNPGEVQVTLKVTYLFNNDQKEVVQKSGTFNVTTYDIHQFKWGDSKERVLEVLPDSVISSVDENVISCNNFNSTKVWGTSIKGVDVNAKFYFDANSRLNKETEVYSVKLENLEQNTYKQTTNRYFYYASTLKIYPTNKPTASWTSTPTDEEIKTLEAVLESNGYGSMSDEQKVTIGQCIAEGKLQFEIFSTQGSTSNINLKVKAGEEGFVDYMVEFTSK